MNFSQYLNEARKSEFNDFSELKDEFIGTPMGQIVTIQGVKMSMNGSRGGNYVIRVLEDGTVKDVKGKKYEVSNGDKIIVIDDGKEIEVEEDTVKYRSFDEVKEMAKHAIDQIKMSNVNSRDDFVKLISSIGGLVSNDLPPSRKKWK